MLSWIREKLGTEDPMEARAAAAPKAPTLDERDAAERRAKALRTQRLRLGGLEAQLAEVTSAYNLAIKQRNTAAATQLLAQKRKFEQEIKNLQGQIANAELADRALQTAQVNHEQTVLLDDAASRLAYQVKQTEALEVEDIADRFSDAAADNLAITQTLSRPLFVDPEAADPDDIDAEVAALIAEQDDAAALNQLDQLNAPMGQDNNQGPGGGQKLKTIEK